MSLRDFRFHVLTAYYWKGQEADAATEGGGEDG